MCVIATLANNGTAAVIVVTESLPADSNGANFPDTMDAHAAALTENRWVDVHTGKNCSHFNIGILGWNTQKYIFGRDTAHD